MGGLLCFIGIVMIVLQFNGVEKVGIVGIGLFVIGFIICMVNAEEEETRARINRRRYWAYGEEPDWKRKRRR